MSIIDVLDKFTDAVAHIEGSRQSLTCAAGFERARLIEQQQRATDLGREGKPVELGSGFFKCASTGRVVFYAFTAATIEDQLEELIRRTNRQLQWLLVEVFESFEEFARGAASWGGFPHLRKPFPILNEFNRRFSRLASLESTNALDANLRLVVGIVCEMRNRIVHERGKVTDRNEFARKVLRDAGPLTGNVVAPERFIGDHLVLRSDGAIWLMNLPAEPQGMYHDQFGFWCDRLLGYAHAISVALEPTLHTRRISPPKPADTRDALDSGGR